MDNLLFFFNPLLRSVAVRPFPAGTSLRGLNIPEFGSEIGNNIENTEEEKNTDNTENTENTENIKILKILIY